jgi:AMP nucleosidase
MNKSEVNMEGHELTEEQFAKETLERYSGSKCSDFCSNLIITNFPRYVEYFAKSRNVPIIEGSMFKVAHCPKEDISILMITHLFHMCIVTILHIATSTIS